MSEDKNSELTSAPSKPHPTLNFDIVTEMDVWVYTEDRRNISHYGRDAGISQS